MSRVPRWLLGVAVATTALLLVGASVRAASAPIPGSTVLLIEEDSYQKGAVLGGSVSFRWGLVNQGPALVTIAVNGSVSAPGFALRIEPPSAPLARDQYIEVFANVTLPSTGGAQAASVSITFTVITGPNRFSATRVAEVTAKPSVGVTTLALAFATVGFVIFIGFVAVLAFQRTKIPDILILIALGLLLGPLTEHLLGISLVPRDFLLAATPYFAALALMFILFDGGLNLRLNEVVRRIGISSAHTLGIFLLTVASVSAVCIGLLGYPPAIGLLLGTALGGTSSAVVIGIVRSMRVDPDTKIILTLESVITDVLCVIGALAIIEYLRVPGASPSTAFVSLAQAFSVAIVASALFGLLWLRLLKHLEGVPFSFMITIAALFVLFAVVEFLGGSGAMAAFVFGLVLGNHDTIASHLRFRMRFTLDEKFKQFHSELSFLVRTFFFVFLGLVFSLDVGGSWDVSTTIPGLAALSGTYQLFLLGVGAIFAGIVLVRYAVVFGESWFRPRPLGERRAMVSLMGRGLAAAVLASLPFTISAFTDPADPSYAGYHALMAPFERQFHDLAFFVILLSVVATTLGVAFAERGVDFERMLRDLRRRAGPGAPAEVSEALPRPSDPEDP